MALQDVTGGPFAEVPITRTETVYIAGDEDVYLLTQRQSERVCKALGLDATRVGNMRWVGDTAIVYETLVMDVPIELRKELGNG